jgi:ribose transport system permease protein
MTLLRGMLNALWSARLAAGLFIVLVAVNLLLSPARFAPSALGTTLGLAAPLILAALASTPVILAGRGGMDISVGPLMGLLNVVVVQYLTVTWGLESPLIFFAVVMVLGALSGLINGVLTAVVHIQPIVATLGTYLVYSGLTLYLMPAPGGTIPDWLRTFSGGGSFIPILLVLTIWWLLQRTAAYEQIMFTGGDDRAAYTSGMRITQVRLLAYVLTGVFAGIGALSLSALLGSADPTVGPDYTLIAIAAAVLGGVNLAGGRGTLIGALLGALDIFLLQSVLTFFNVSTFVLQMAYGVILVAVVTFNSPRVQARLARLLRRRRLPA